MRQWIDERFVAKEYDDVMARDELPPPYDWDAPDASQEGAMAYAIWVIEMIEGPSKEGDRYFPNY